MGEIQALYQSTFVINQKMKISMIVVIIAEDKNAGNETVTPEPVKGVAKSEEARPLPLIMSHSNNNNNKKYLHLLAN